MVGVVAIETVRRKRLAEKIARSRRYKNARKELGAIGNDNETERQKTKDFRITEIEFISDGGGLGEVRICRTGKLGL